MCYVYERRDIKNKLTLHCNGMNVEINEMFKLATSSKQIITDKGAIP